MLRSAVRPVVVVAGVLALAWSSQAGVTAGLGRGRGASGPQSYTLRSGDTLSGVAARFGVSIDRLASANNIGNIHRVYAGKRLSIPGASDAVTATGGTDDADSKAAAVRARNPRFPALLLAHPERLTLDPTFEKWANAYGVPADLMKALAWMESGWQNSVVSSAKAVGVGQLTPATVDFVSNQLLRVPLDPKVPEDNIRMSARYVRYLMDQTGGDVRSTLAAYFQGLGSVRRGGILAVSKWYADSILALRPLFA